MCRNSMCLWIFLLRTEGISLTFFTIALVWQLITQAVPLPPPFPLSFHCFDSVTGACSSYCVGAHCWVARISQPWEQSSSRSWLPVVEAPGCLGHSTSILAMQLLTQITNDKFEKLWLNFSS